MLYMNKRFLAVPLLCLAVISVTALAIFGQGSSTVLKRGNEFPKDTVPKIAVAYVVDVGKKPIDPYYFTHLIYAFAEFNDSCDGLEFKSPERLQSMVDLKKQNPDLKVMIGVGGYKRKGFSEMAKDKKKRKHFIKNIKHVLDSLKLDGVDLDWEFPTTENGGHTATPQDDRNYVTFVKELRKSLGKDKWISYYSFNSGEYIDHKGMAPYVTHVNVSGYNLSVPQEGKRAYHQSPLYSSDKIGNWSIIRSIQKHIDLGVPKDKILMGIPFYGRGKSPFPTYTECRMFDRYAEGLNLKWDEEAQAPYYANENGELIVGFDDERSIEAKFNFLRANGIPGVFVWHYDGDYPDRRLSKTIQRLRK